jgi:hypothetical protein
MAKITQERVLIGFKDTVLISAIMTRNKTLDVGQSSVQYICEWWHAILYRGSLQRQDPHQPST